MRSVDWCNGCRIKDGQKSVFMVIDGMVLSVHVFFGVPFDVVVRLCGGGDE